jgi:3-methyladenine DNA glycosylase AlkC
MFGKPYFTRLAEAVRQIHKPFRQDVFLRQVLEPLPALSLNERMRHTSVTLKQHLPDNYQTTIGILRDVAPLTNRGYTALVFPDFVSQFGTHDVRTSLDALHYFTKFGSSEFAVRTFLKLDFDRTIRIMHEWSNDDDEHVRRLASEGSRPRLPWSFKLDMVINNPESTRGILENLKEDDSLYVRKSVANHLNDITKDSPQYVLKLIKGWDQKHVHTQWIIKRGCRSLFKLGDKQSLRAFNFTQHIQIGIRQFSITPKVKIGGLLTFGFDLASKSGTIQKLMVDYRIHYIKKSGQPSVKVFKLKEIELKPGEVLPILKTQRFQDFTTRKHFAGKHKLEIVVNGEVVKKSAFDVT